MAREGESLGFLPRRVLSPAKGRAPKAHSEGTRRLWRGCPWEVAHIIMNLPQEIYIPDWLSAQAVAIPGDLSETLRDLDGAIG